MRNIFPDFIYNQLATDKKIFILLGDIGVHGFRKVFQNYKNHILNLGILEQSMISFAAGLAMEGRTPFVHTIAPFMVNRAYEQIKIDLCYQNLNVNIVSVGASIDYAALGSTHHCPEDVAILSKLPNMQIYCPGNSRELANLLKKYNMKGPKYFRLSNHFHNLQIPSNKNFTLLKKGKKGLIVVIGPALRFVENFYKFIDANIIYINKIKPLDEVFLKKHFREKIVIVQDFYKGSISSDILAVFKNRKIACKEIGLPIKFFLNYGTPSEHYNMLGLNDIKIKKEIIDFFR